MGSPTTLLLQTIALCIHPTKAFIAPQGTIPSLDANFAGILKHNPVHRAPLIGCDEPLRVPVPNYIVVLFPGYTFKEHWRDTGKNRKEFNIGILSAIYHPAIAYMCYNVPDQVLDTIRKSESVKEVVCDGLYPAELELEQSVEL